MQYTVLVIAVATTHHAIKRDDKQGFSTQGIAINPP